MKLLVRKEFEMWLVQWKRYFFGTNADLLKATLTSFFSEWPLIISIWHRSLIPAKLPFINQRSWMLVELFPVTVNFSGVFGWTSKGKKKPSVIRKKPTYFSSEKSYFRRSERIRRISVSISNWENWGWEGTCKQSHSWLSSQLSNIETDLFKTGCTGTYNKELRHRKTFSLLLILSKKWNISYFRWPQWWMKFTQLCSTSVNFLSQDLKSAD